VTAVFAALAMVGTPGAAHAAQQTSVRAGNDTSPMRHNVSKLIMRSRPADAMKLDFQRA
jgi:hypothetical protein